jgi:DNA-binding winged helix-turn-helix (wHTH) protein
VPIRGSPMVGGENSVAIEPQRAGLTALVVYLRPAPRLRLLRLLAELGIFVVEHEGRTDALRTAFGTRTDFIIVAGADDPEHAALAGQLLQALSSVLVVVLPPGASEEPYQEAGAAVCIPEDVSDGGFATLLGPAVREARAIRRTGEIAAEYLVFRDIRFRTAPPELLRGSLSVSLTPVESEVLGELSRSLGQVVRNEALERHVINLSSRAELRAGYVKAIIRRIRRKVEQVGGNAELLRNIRGFGYMLVS